MRTIAPAKVNLHLRVGPPRADGFHPLLTWMVTIGLFDTLELERTRGQGVRLICDRADLPAGPSNLVCRAAMAMIERGRQRLEGSAAAAGADESTPMVGGVQIRLTKRIPVGAGLGGGSSDAARTLFLLNRWWQLGWSQAQLVQQAAALGSDVPFFLHEPSAICRGRGEQVQPIASPAPRWLVLLSPPFGCSTPDVYRAFDQLEPVPGWDTEPDWAAWTQLDSTRLLPLLVNDLEPAAFIVRPELGKLRDRTERLIGRTVRMSGSGSALFTLFDDEAEAREAAVRAERELPDLRARAVELCPNLDEAG